MPPLPDRTTLSNLSRADLQKLCKDRGLRANMKSDVLINMLIETTKPETTKPASTSQIPQRISSTRTVSRPASTRGRVGSMIIHDIPEDVEMDDSDDPPIPNGSVPPPSSIPGPASRTRKAKEVQSKLGLGRPRLIGGTGPRTVSRKPSSAPERRSRVVTSAKPSEAAIREEDEEDHHEPQAGPSGTKHDTQLALVSSPPKQVVAVQNGPDMLEIVNPLRNQVQDVQAELKQLSTRTADIDSLRSAIDDLRTEVATLRSQHSLATDLEAQVKMLREELASLRSSQPSEPAHTRTITGGSSNQSGAFGDSQRTVLAAEVDASMVTQSSLGKRTRGSEDLTGVIEEGTEAEMPPAEAQRQVVRPKRKRAKLEAPRSTPGAGPSGGVNLQTDVQMEDVGDGDEIPIVPPIRRGPSFTVFSGPEEPPEPTSDAPPTAHLSDIFTFPSSTPPNGATPSVPTMTANAAENQAPSTGNNAFTFSFATSLFEPMTSTPHESLPHIPSLEPPTSPTPTFVERAGGRRERNDPFHPTGFPRRPPSGIGRPASRASQQPGGSNAGPSRQGEATVSPAVVRRTPPLPSVTEESRTSAEGRSGTNNTSANSNSSENASNNATLTSVLGSAAGIRLPPSTSGTLILPGIVPLPTAPDTPARPMKRTMYGTELEGDTRFGDFGVEGVATGFWTGAAPRF